MNTLVVGGTGLIGGATALLLSARGHRVSIAGRNRPAAETPLASFQYRRIDYTCPKQDLAFLAAFDRLVFSAGNDVRHKPADADDNFWHSTNAIAIPRFFENARAAGIKRAVNVGSFYTQAAPHLVETNSYIRSRRDAEVAVAALSGPDFATTSVNAPLVVGALAGLSVPFFDSHVRFALGELAPMPEFVPPGGVNFISLRSLAEAVAGALDRGKAGASYLVGDENLLFRDYFGYYFEAAKRPAPEVRNADAPIFPDRSIYFGRGSTLFYEPDPEEVRLLGYRRNDVRRAIHEMVATYLRRRA